ncbi:hypothetical protein [Mesorhizobium sp.]|uniref:hypothetical protein n=1 Tax=Mesorhizobium sp. TaxID=1871066 RepID=UPI00257BB712|nr:hypothetical protein [Mesorhizobium sp.]
MKADELTGRIRDLKAELTDLQAQIAAVDKVIAIYEPEWNPSSLRSAAAARRVA